MNFTHTDTNLNIENEFPKLVRDLIPDIIEKKFGKKSENKIAEDDEEFRKYLFAKVVEEAIELKEAKNREHVIEELADCLEVIDTILDFEKLSLDDVRKVQKEKRQKRGGFAKRIIAIKKTVNNINS